MQTPLVEAVQTQGDSVPNEAVNVKTTIKRAIEIVIEVPHDAAERKVHELAKTALHHKSVTDALEERNQVVLQVVDNGFMRKGSS